MTTPLQRIATTRLQELEDEYEKKLEEPIGNREGLELRKAKLEFLIDSMNTQRKILGLELINKPKEEINPDED